MADLLVRGVDPAVVRALKKRAGDHGRSAAAEHRASLAAMPDVGRDADFARHQDGGASADVFD
ncbi:MAG: DNA-binding protein [Cyanobium sp. PLM2.Bin73]|jgi:plasmid stability protein|nr:MAG: DNA-binding protein [Cyanobium sp. PLM2.Bin73]